MENSNRLSFKKAITSLSEVMTLKSPFQQTQVTQSVRVTKH